MTATPTSYPARTPSFAASHPVAQFEISHNEVHAHVGQDHALDG